ncbi:hypothetical protein COE25_26090 [Bacillus sp. AFS031507]|nr:hypothetical protein COE25_26090 [Bacillus sp. AFS031507]
MQCQRKLFLLSLLSSFLVILNGFFQWNIVKIITPFLMLSFWLALFVFFIVITVQSMVQLIKYKNWKPFTIHAITPRGHPLSLWEHRRSSAIFSPRFGTVRLTSVFPHQISNRTR